LKTQTFTLKQQRNHEKKKKLNKGTQRTIPKKKKNNGGKQTTVQKKHVLNYTKPKSENKNKKISQRIQRKRRDTGPADEGE